jgi:DNA-binding NarL/FixJ family response regulator
MQSAVNQERSPGAAGTAVVVDAAPRGVRSAATTAAWLGLEVVAEAMWVWAAPTLVERYRPDLLVIACDDAELRLTLVKRIRSSNPETRVVAVLRGGREADHRRLLEAGALVVLTHAKRPGGDVEEKLTARELEVCALLASGLRNDEIARRLWVTDRTVKFHLSNVYKKLGVRSRGEAIAALRRASGT